MSTFHDHVVGLGFRNIDAPTLNPGNTHPSLPGHRDKIMPHHQSPTLNLLKPQLMEQGRKQHTPPNASVTQLATAWVVVHMGQSYVDCRPHPHMQHKTDRHTNPSPQPHASNYWSGVVQYDPWPYPQLTTCSTHTTHSILLARRAIGTGQPQCKTPGSACQHPAPMAAVEGSRIRRLQATIKSSSLQSVRRLVGTVCIT
jgi:hypothetical protein